MICPHVSLPLDAEESSTQNSAQPAPKRPAEEEKEPVHEAVTKEWGQEPDTLTCDQW